MDVLPKYCPLSYDLSYGQVVTAVILFNLAYTWKLLNLDQRGQTFYLIKRKSLEWVLLSEKKSQ